MNWSCWERYCSQRGCDSESLNACSPHWTKRWISCSPRSEWCNPEVFVPKRMAAKDSELIWVTSISIWFNFDPTLRIDDGWYIIGLEKATGRSFCLSGPKSWWPSEHHGGSLSRSQFPVACGLDTLWCCLVLWWHCPSQWLRATPGIPASHLGLSLLSWTDWIHPSVLLT